MPHIKDIVYSREQHCVWCSILRVFLAVSNLQKALTSVELTKSLVLSSKANIQNVVHLTWCPYHGKELTE